MKKIKFVYVVLIIFVLASILRIFDLSIFKKDHYMEELDKINEIYVAGKTAQRGRILDVNGKVLVDTIGVNTVIYNRIDGSSESQEISTAYALGAIIKFTDNLFTESKLKPFYLATHEDGENLITEEEKKLYRERKLNKQEIASLKNERITKEVIDGMTPEDKNAAYIYYLLRNGYYYEDKIIKKGLTDEEVVKINDLNIPGIKIELSWDRYYPYGGVLRSIFGGISTNGVPLEYKEYYKDLGINQDRIVGISGLELEYDKYLRGKDAKYELKDGRLVLVEEEEKGSDLYLSIDIDKQLALENIIKEEMKNAKKMNNTSFFNHSYAIIGDPNTGEIVAAAGLQLNGNHFIDITSNMISSSYTVGSIVKGATISVGYKEGLVTPGKKIKDSCIKVSGAKEKCSWTSLGYIDDIKALAQSSNYYQFLIAAKLANKDYKWNSKLNSTKEHFDIYRNMLASYGLGTKTGIDLPNERNGIIGGSIRDDLLLNLAIGQYDTYTPIEAFQYISTIANNGTRLAPSLMKKIVKNDEVILERDVKVLNSVPLESEYIKRIQAGLHEVMISGTGKNYANGMSSAGKTGTSETYIDSNGDGKMDRKTTSTAFVMYAPFENPKYSLVLLSPNISSDGHKYSFNLRVNKKIVNYLFENS